MREVRAFGSIREVVNLPNLTNIQIASYKQFLQLGVAAAQRENVVYRPLSKRYSRSTRPSGGGRPAWYSTF